MSAYLLDKKAKAAGKLDAWWAATLAEGVQLPGVSYKLGLDGYVVETPVQGRNCCNSM